MRPITYVQSIKFKPFSIFMRSLTRTRRVFMFRHIFPCCVVLSLALFAIAQKKTGEKTQIAGASL
jgi:hypothetical protein